VKGRLAANLAFILIAGCTVPGSNQQATPTREPHMQRSEAQRPILRPFAAADGQDFRELALDWKAAPGPAFDKWRTSEEA